MTSTDDHDHCPACGAPPDEPCRLGPGPTGDGHTSCGDGHSNITNPQTEEATA